MRITGRLLNAQGLPVAGASLDVLQKIAGATLELIGHVRTGTDGTFVAHVAGGPSRMVEIGYRAFSADSDYSATARLVEAVRAGVQLSVTPRRTGSEGADHSRRACARAGPAAGRRRRAARSLPRPIGSHSAIHARTRAGSSASPTNSRAASGGYHSGRLCSGAKATSRSHSEKARRSMSPRTDRRRHVRGLRHALSGDRLRDVALAVLIAGVVGLMFVPGARAGTYVIDNCPSAGNGDAGSWTVFGSPQNVKGTCQRCCW